MNLLFFDNYIKMKENNSKKQSLFQAIYVFPVDGSKPQSLIEIKKLVGVVSEQLLKLPEKENDVIQRYCYKNGKLIFPAKLLRDLSLNCDDRKDGIPANLLTQLVSMFRLMINGNKMVEFLMKINLPLSIYHILVRNYARYKLDFVKKREVIQCFRFIKKLLVTNPSLFPRMFANFMNSMLIENYRQKFERKKQNQPYFEEQQFIVNLMLDLINLNLKLAAQSGVLIIMYRRATEGDLEWSSIASLIEIIVTHFNRKETRDIILSSLDLGKVFAVFCNVDFKQKQWKDWKSEEKVDKCACIIQQLLSSWATLIYFLQEKETLKNFVAALKSRNTKEFTIINEKIVESILGKGLRYNWNKMESSNNWFGLQSNNLNYRSLLLMEYLLESTELFQMYWLMETKGEVLRNLGKLSLKYFPLVYQKEKYNKAIINSIRTSELKEVQETSEYFLNIHSYLYECILPYEFKKEELLSFAIEMKGQQNWERPLKQKIDDLIVSIKKSSQHVHSFLFLKFYSVIIEMSEQMLWDPSNLKITKFLSGIVQYLYHHDWVSISCECLKVMNRIFSEPKKDFYRYLYITILEDIGRYFGDHQTVHDVIFKHSQNPSYSFRISRILYNLDYEKEQMNESFRNIIQQLCEQENTSIQLLYQAIQIIKRYCEDSDEKIQWGRKIICEKLLYHPNYEIASLSIEFSEDIIASNKMDKKFLSKIEFKRIKDSFLRKRMMSLLLGNEKGFEALDAYDPNFTKDEIEGWFRRGANTMKQLANFFDKETYRYNKKKEANYLSVDRHNRAKLVCLPWNIKINQQFFVALASYKSAKQKIKLQISPKICIENILEISPPYIGAVPFIINKDKKFFHPILIKKEEVLRSYQRNTRQGEKVERFTFFKDKVTFQVKYSRQCFILEKITINIPLARDIYLPFSYPINLFSVLCKTSQGVAIIKRENIVQKCLKLINQEKDPAFVKQISQQVRGAIFCLGQLFESKGLQANERLQILDRMVKIFEESSPYEIKEAVIWVINIIVKDEECRNKLMKEIKGWFTMESKYCGFLCYPRFYNEKSLINTSITRFSYIRQSLPEKLNSQGQKLILAYLNTPDKTDKIDRDGRIEKDRRKKQLMEHFKRKDKQYSFDPKLFQSILRYMAIINFAPEKIKEVLQIFQQYIQSQKFNEHFQNGFVLP